VTDASDATIRYRLVEDRDLPEVLALWQADSGWGAITSEQWREWYVDTPEGPAIVGVAEDQGRIVGQGACLPAWLVVGEREVMAGRISAPIVRMDARHLPSPSHPVVGLAVSAMEAMAGAGWSVAYMLPDRGWLPLMRHASTFGFPELAIAEFPAVAASTGAKRGSCVVEEGLPPDDELTGLWNEARRGLPIEIGVWRTPRWIAYKNGAHTVLTVRASDGSLLGYTSTDGSGLLRDVLARSREDLAHVLESTLATLGALRGLAEVKAMATPALAPALDEAGFDPIDYSFGFCTRPLDDDLTFEDVDPERWWICPGD
jgi:hypothetical protein